MITCRVVPWYHSMRLNDKAEEDEPQALQNAQQRSRALASLHLKAQAPQNCIAVDDICALLMEEHAPAAARLRPTLQPLKTMSSPAKAKSHQAMDIPLHRARHCVPQQRACAIKQINGRDVVQPRRS